MNYHFFIFIRRKGKAMSTLITLFIFLVIGYVIVSIVSRKQRELAEKESRQRDQFIQESQLILKEQLPSSPHKNPSTTRPPSVTQEHIKQVINYFLEHGYKVGDIEHFEGIDMIGIKEKELLLVRCESSLKEIRQQDLKEFIADCTVYLDKNPMFHNRTVHRVYATTSPMSVEALDYARLHTSSIRILENLA